MNKRLYSAIATLGLLSVTVVGTAQAQMLQPTGTEISAEESTRLLKIIEANDVGVGPDISALAQCQFVNVSQADRTKIFTALNAMRAYTRLAPVKELPATDSRWKDAQEASISMATKGAIAHGLTSSEGNFPCYTQGGADSSNQAALSYTYRGKTGWGFVPEVTDESTHVRNLISDDDVATKGHRLQLLSPLLENSTMGVAKRMQTSRVSNGGTKVELHSALEIETLRGLTSYRGLESKSPAIVAWPSSGYFPTALLPRETARTSEATATQWSFGAVKLRAGSAKVTVKGPDGSVTPKVVSIPTDYAMGLPQITFNPFDGAGELAYPQNLKENEVRVYTVTVDDGVSTWTYPVRIYSKLSQASAQPEPTAPQPTTPTTPVTPPTTQPAVPASQKPAADSCLASDTCNAYFVDDFATTKAKLGMKLSVVGKVYAGDWDADREKVSTLALRDGENFTFYEKNRTGSAARTIRIEGIGSAGEVFTADVNQDKKADVVIRIGNLFYAKTDLTTSGKPTLLTAYGKVTDEAFLGDWDGDGVATPGVRRGNLIMTRDDFLGGQATTSYNYGRMGDVIFIGDWDGNRTDTISLRRSNIFYTLNSPHGGEADQTIPFGRATDQMVAGDWNGDNVDTIAVIRR